MSSLQRILALIQVFLVVVTQSWDNLKDYKLYNNNTCAWNITDIDVFLDLSKLNQINMLEAKGDCETDGGVHQSTVFYSPCGNRVHFAVSIHVS